MIENFTYTFLFLFVVFFTLARLGLRKGMTKKQVEPAGAVAAISFVGLIVTGVIWIWN